MDLVVLSIKETPLFDLRIRPFQIEKSMNLAFQRYLPIYRFHYRFQRSSSTNVFIMRGGRPLPPGHATGLRQLCTMLCKSFNGTQRKSNRKSLGNDLLSISIHQTWQDQKTGLPDLGIFLKILLNLSQDLGNF